jgi:hypothetical protein
MPMPAPDGHGGHQDGDGLRRQRPPGEPDDDERDRGPQPDQHDAVGEVAGARRSQDCHRRQVEGRAAAEEELLAVRKGVSGGGRFDRQLDADPGNADPHPDEDVSVAPDE